MNLVLSQANKVTLEQPFLTFPRSDGWTVFNSLLNEISGSVNPVGFFKKDAGIHKWYIFGITNEKSPLLFQSKLRVLLIDEEDLQRIILDCKNPKPTLSTGIEDPFIKVRWETLRAMAKLYEASKKLPNQEQKEVCFGKVEIVL